MTSRAVRPLAIYPAEIMLGGIMFLVGMTFLLFPPLLEHSPINFETRGLIHHIWHHLLTWSAFLVLVSHYYHGRFGQYAPRLRLIGLLGLLATLLVNLLAIVIGDFQNPPIEAGGIDVGLRVAAILFLAARVRSIVRPARLIVEPVSTPATTSEGVALQILTERNRDESTVLRRMTRRNREGSP